MTIADAGLRRIVQDHLHKSKGWLWNPIETGATHQGVPDSFWAHEPTQTSGWIEHKMTNGWAVTIRPHQVAWFETHRRAGVHCLFLIRARGVGSSNRSGDSLWAVSGDAARDLAQGGLNELPASALLGRWVGSPKDWNWANVMAILTSQTARRRQG